MQAECRRVYCEETIAADNDSTILWFYIEQREEENAFYLVLGLAVKAFNRSREIISGTRPEPFAKL